MGEESSSRFRLTKDGKVYFKGKKVYANRDVYEGEFVDSMRHGEGKMTFIIGDQYHGEFERNLFHGFGSYSWQPDFNEFKELIVGRRYEGDWKDGKQHGKGVYMVGNGDVYTGCFMNGTYEGIGTLKKSTGDIYTGEWSRGMPNGDMKIKLANGDTYDGSLLVGRFHGQGKYVYSNDMGYYEGQWSKGKSHGRGVRIYSNGSKFVGTFFEGEIDGDGMMFYVNGDQYLGQWRAGFMEGKGVYRYNHGDSYEGTFLKGYRYGEGKYQYKDGSFYSGEYRNLRFNRHKNLEGQVRMPLCDGLRHGFGVRVWASGARYEGEWREDRMHGVGMLVTKEGAKYQGHFYNNLKNGEGTEQFGNELGVPLVCPLGHAHKGMGFCTYTGGYSKGFFHGHGEFQCLNGQHYKGEWHRGKRHGQGTQYYIRKGEMGDADRLFIGGVDSLYRVMSFTGTWDSNVRSGIGVLTYTNKDTIEGHFRCGQPHGVVVYKFHGSGKTRLGRYEQGERIEWIETKHSKNKPLKAQKKRYSFSD